MSIHEYTRREESRDRITRIATLAAMKVHHGAGWSSAIRDVADELEISRAAVAYCVKQTARTIQDPYLESIGA